MAFVDNAIIDGVWLLKYGTVFVTERTQSPLLKQIPLVEKQGGNKYWVLSCRPVEGFCCHGLPESKFELIILLQKIYIFFFISWLYFFFFFFSYDVFLFSAAIDRKRRL